MSHSLRINATFCLCQINQHLASLPVFDFPFSAWPVTHNWGWLHCLNVLNCRWPLPIKSQTIQEHPLYLFPNCLWTVNGQSLWLSLWTGGFRKFGCSLWFWSEATLTWSPSAMAKAHSNHRWHNSWNKDSLMRKDILSSGSPLHTRRPTYK